MKTETRNSIIVVLGVAVFLVLLFAIDKFLLNPPVPTARKIVVQKKVVVARPPQTDYSAYNLPSHWQD